MTESILATTAADGTTTIYVERDMGITTDKPALLGEIVRCKDCNPPQKDEHGSCLILAFLMSQSPLLYWGDDYCAWGERKEGRNA